MSRLRASTATIASPVGSQTLELEFDAGPGIKAYVLRVDEQPVGLTNGKGSVNVAPGKHTLGWRVAGNEGATFTISGSAGGNSVVQVSDRIVASMGIAAGAKEFQS